MVKLVSYRIIGSQNKIIYSSSFEYDLFVKHEWANLIISDLSSFTLYQGGSFDFCTELKISVGEDFLTIIRDYTNKLIRFDPYGVTSVDEWLKSHGIASNTIFNSDNFLDTHKLTENEAASNIIKLLSSESGENSYTKEELWSKIFEINSEMAGELMELEDKLNILEKELSRQETVDEYNLAQAEIRSQVDEINTQFKNVDGLIQKQMKIHKYLEPYGQLAKSDLELQALQYQQEIIKKRGEYLASIQNTNRHVITDDVEHSSSKPIVGKWAILFAILISVFGGVTFFISNDWKLLVIIVISVALQIGISIAINKLPQTVEPEAIRLNDYIEKTLVTENVTHKPTFIERFFIDKAWIKALHHELKSLRESINHGLGNSDYESLLLLKNNLGEQVNAINYVIDNGVSNHIEPSIYLDKKREVESIYARQKKLLSDLKSIAPDANLDKIYLELNSLEPDAHGLAMNLYTGIAEYSSMFAALRVNNGKLESLRKEDNSKWSNNLPPFNELKIVLVLITINNWIESKSSPVFVVTGPVSSNPLITLLVRDRIFELRQQAQLIVLNQTADAI